MGVEPRNEASQIQHRDISVYGDFARRGHICSQGCKVLILVHVCVCACACACACACVCLFVCLRMPFVCTNNRNSFAAFDYIHTHGLCEQNPHNLSVCSIIYVSMKMSY